MVQEVRALDVAYFQQHESRVSDATYDRKLALLGQLELEHPEWVTPESPTQRLASELRPDKFVSREHRTPMLSLGKLFELEEVHKWVRRFASYNGNLVLEPKLDGLALSARYEHGQMVCALTRGDGQYGDDVTWQASGVLGLPKVLNSNVPHPSVLDVRGEVIMLKSVFEQVNRDRTAGGVELLANPRNAAAGALKSLDDSALRERKLRFVPYSLGYASPDHMTPASENYLLAWLKTLGFAHLPLLKVVPHDVEPAVLEDIITRFNFERQHLDFGTDGLVIKLANLRYRESLGVPSGKLYLGAVAFKFAAEEVDTVCRSVTFQVGRTGAITPVAELEPVELDGSTVARATLHNRSRIQELGLHIGDVVTIRKAGDIIPEVVSVMFRSPDRHPVVFPTSCPVCKAPVRTKKNADESDTAVLFCTGDACAGQLQGKLVHWCSRACMDIQSAGYETAGLLVRAGLVKSIPDLYRLTFDDLLRLPGFGHVSADNLFSEIAASRAQGMARVLSGFGIPKFGRSFSDKMAREYPDIHSFAAAVRQAEHQEKQVAGLGAVVQSGLANWLVDNQVVLRELEALGVSLASKEHVPPDQRKEPLKGWVVVFTGALTVERDLAAKWAMDLGAKVTSSVSGKTTHLVVGEDAGSKLEKAQKLGIKILDENQFKEAVGQA